MAVDKISKFQLFTPQNLWYDQKYSWNTYPIISSGEERPSFCKILLVRVVLGPRPSYAFITAVNACAAIPYPLQGKKTSTKTLDGIKRAYQKRGVRW